MSDYHEVVSFSYLRATSTKAQKKKPAIKAARLFDVLKADHRDNTITNTINHIARRWSVIGKTPYRIPNQYMNYLGI